MLWIKAFHLIAMVTWFAGLFYLPRLFVYHTQVTDPDNNARFKTMERKLYRAITTPGMVVTVALGVWLVGLYGWDWFRVSHWFHAKLALVVLLIVFHFYCGRLVRDFDRDDSRHSERFYRILNEVPVLPLVGIIILAVVKPF